MAKIGKITKIVKNPEKRPTAGSRAFSKITKIVKKAPLPAVGRFRKNHDFRQNPGGTPGIPGFWPKSGIFGISGKNTKFRKKTSAPSQVDKFSSFFGCPGCRPKSLQVDVFDPDSTKVGPSTSPHTRYLAEKNSFSRFWLKSTPRSTFLGCPSHSGDLGYFSKKTTKTEMRGVDIVPGQVLGGRFF